MSDSKDAKDLERLKIRNISPLTIKQGQSRFKKRFLVCFLIAGGCTFVANYYRTDLIYHYQETPFNKWIIQNCHEFRKGTYKPTWYLPTRFIQCVYGAKINAIPYVPYTRDYVKLKDGGQISLDWCYPLESCDKDDTKILLILHGLTGASDANYIGYAVLNGQRNGFRTVVVNARGLSNTELTTPKYHNYADTNDLKEAIQFIKEKHPQADIYCLAISIGANLALKYAGETKNECEFKAIVSIANPFDLEKCANEINKWHKWIYHHTLLTGFKKNYFKNKDMLIKSGKFEPELVENARTIEEFDQNFTIKINNFLNLKDYYNQISCKNVIKDVSVPTLCIYSRDDPVIHPNSIPYDDIKKNPNLFLLETQRGGHIDWFSTRYARRWAYYPAMEYLQAVERYQNNDFMLQKSPKKI